MGNGRNYESEIDLAGLQGSLCHGRTPTAWDSLARSLAPYLCGSLGFFGKLVLATIYRRLHSSRMRRPPTGGMIRPRTIGGRAAVPEPAPPVAPAFPVDSAASNGRKKRLGLLALGLVVLYLVYANFISSGGGEDAVGFESNSIALGGGEEGLGVAEEEEEEEEDKPVPKPAKSKKKAPKMEEEEEQEEGDGEEEEKPEDGEGEGGGEGEGDGAESSAAEGAEEEEEETAAVEEKDEDKPSKRLRTSVGGGKDPARSVQSYFANFGGNVVEIDKEGSFKYVLVRMEDSSGDSALLVRGCPKSEGAHCKHHHAFSRAKAELELRGFVATAKGGGRITRHPSRHRAGQKEGYLSVFGYSKTFGACQDCNKIACTLIKAAYPDYGVKYSNEGYLESDERKIADSSWAKC
ncbi:hypothetical protein BASA81_002356 [Batrachochytrium salamandrivorans]|nr:hypothetical protein BASA81_002356 [Batrachochytrium salamandrivorans]